jgi:lysine 2,3-aminomutase
MKILGDSDWLDALTKAAEDARRMFKEVVLHTHFNHPNEITGLTEDALNTLFGRGISVRNLSVMLRGVNDDVNTMTMLCRRLTWMNVRPYYSYMCDMVVGIEDLRFPLSKGLEIERGVRGALSGPYTPLFVVDPPGGCGKRNVHSYELYDKESGLSIYSAPSVKARQLFLYADPLHSLSSEVAAAWLQPKEARGFVSRALASIGASEKDLGTALSW